MTNTTMDPSGSEFAGQRIAITGVCGTVGRELLSQILNTDAESVIGLDHNESELFFVGQDYRTDPRVSVSLGDVRDRAAMFDRLAEVDTVFHTAALKHVPLCEQSPMEAVHTNIAGTQNLIDASMALPSVKRLVFTSTDKAVNPTNVMGTSKLMAERLVTASQTAAPNSPASAISTRFGNVLGSRGSVLPVFRRQIASGGPVTLTDPDMTRFVMSLEEAVSLVMRSTHLGEGGEVFITKMKVARIEDIAMVMIDELAPQFGFDSTDISIEVIGARPGEKMYEELMNDEEVRRSHDIGDFIVVAPALSVNRGQYGTKMVDRPYNSAVEPAMTPDELRDYLSQNGLLNKED